MLIFLIARTPAREPLFKWAVEFLRIQHHFYKLRHQYLQARRFTRLVVSGQKLDNFRKLVNRQVHLVPLPEGDVAQMCELAAFDCRQLERLYTLDEITSSLQMAYSLGTPDAVVDRTRAAFQKLAAEGVVKRVMDRK